MSAPTTTAEVTAFLAGVRDALDDLHDAERDDLLGGLEADVQEAYEQALADSGTAPGWFADPAAYAAELRASAGLPPRGAAPSAAEGSGTAPELATKQRRHPVTELRQNLGAVQDNLRSRPWWPWAAGFGQALEPVWWVARAWALCAVLAVLSGMDVGLVPGTGLLGLLVFVAAVVASVQLGRGLWRLPDSWGPAARTGVNVVGGLVVAFVALAAVLGGVSGGWSGPDYSPELDASSNEVGDGVWVRGEPATNLFVYGPDGRLIEGAQVVDQAGRPVVLTSDGEPLYADNGETLFLTPRKNTFGIDVPNAYPVPQQREMTAWDDETGSETMTRTPYNNHPPLVVVPPLAGPSPSPSPSSPSPSSPSPSPSPSPSD